MQSKAEKERGVFAKTIEAETLAEKKAKVYAKLLTDPKIAKTMEEIALRHGERVETLAKILGLKKNEKSNEYEVNENGVEA